MTIITAGLLNIMSDAYEPKLDALILTEEEQDSITAAMTTERPWDIKSDGIESVKHKFRAHHSTRHGNTCCYCRTNLHGGGSFMIDREHILPKKKYKAYTYAIWNISVSCKRCNMQLKGDRDDFVIDKVSVLEFEKASNYRIIHPNFDEWELHLNRVSQQSNRKLLVIYRIHDDSEKGLYTHRFFRLKELEVDSFDEAQGISRRPEQSETRAVLEARAIARAHGQ